MSCNKADTGYSEGMIAFRQVGLSSELDVTVATKATEVTGSTLNSGGFNVSATTGSAGSESSAWNNVAFSKVGDYFVGTGSGKWWPTSDPGYHFYASNTDLTFAAGGTTVAAINEADVVCAYLASPTYNSTNTLTFEHIFARITDVTLTAVEGYTITGVSVYVTPKTGGTYNLRTGAGRSDGTGCLPYFLSVLK